MKQGTDAWGHTVTVLMGNLLEGLNEPSSELIKAGRILDKFYIPTRYPNGFDSGAPTDYYTPEEAEMAITQAEVILEFCNLQISKS
jgi:HEPN domain-containing protein